MVAKLIVESNNKEHKQRAWEFYLSIYPHMKEEARVSFEEFYKQDKGNDDTPIEVILDDVKKLLEENKGAWTS